MKTNKTTQSWAVVVVVGLSACAEPPALDTYSGRCIRDADCVVVSVPMCASEGCASCGDAAIAQQEVARFFDEQTQPFCNFDPPPTDCAACPDFVATCQDRQCKMHDCSEDPVDACPDES